MTESKANKKRKPIGRRLDRSIKIDHGPETPSYRYTLSSGREALFGFAHIPAEDVEAMTYVNQLTNGREQSVLTQASVHEISKTIVHQQFFPAIGRRDQDQKIELLDGSRRRAAAIYSGIGLDVLVTHEHLTAGEARHLAQSIQTAREHHLREVGLRLKLLLEHGDLNQNELAEAEGLSPSKVTRALQAASVPSDLISIFPVVSELTYPDYRLLNEISDQLGDDPTRQSTISSLHDFVEHLDPDLPADQAKSTILTQLKTYFSPPSSSKDTERAKVERLWKFADRNRYARIRRKGRSVHYEFSRLSSQLQDDLDEAIRSVLNKHLS